LYHSSDKQTLILKTGGPKKQLKTVPVPRRQSSVASKHTIQRRTKHLRNFRRNIAGTSSYDSSDIQFSCELKGLLPKVRNSVLDGAGVGLSSFNAEDGVQIKSYIGLSYTQYRKLKSVFRAKQVKFQSERKERLKTKDILKQHFIVDDIKVIRQDNNSKSNSSEQNSHLG
jgi:hypothetical protein